MCEKQEHTVPTARKKNISITERLSSTVSHSRKVKHSLSPEKKKKTEENRPFQTTYNFKRAVTTEAISQDVRKK